MQEESSPAAVFVDGSLKELRVGRYLQEAAAPSDPPRNQAPSTPPWHACTPCECHNENHPLPALHPIAHAAGEVSSRPQRSEVEGSAVVAKRLIGAQFPVLRRSTDMNARSN